MRGRYPTALMRERPPAGVARLAEPPPGRVFQRTAPPTRVTIVAIDCWIRVCVYLRYPMRSHNSIVNLPK